MEEFRHIECGGCQTVLRFKITEKITAKPEWLNVKNATVKTG